MSEISTGQPQPKASFGEFVTILALAMSLVALTIDSILPALPQVGESYDLTRPNDLQYLITVLFVGLSIGQLIAGPLSDALGRKPALYIGLIVFMIGTLISYISTDYTLMLVGRFIQGLGAAAPRIVTMAMVRDRYVGRDMARVMSYIMGVFILVPILAPAVGQGVMMIAGWRAIFLFYLIIAGLVFIWGGMRLEETRAPEDKRDFKLKTILGGVKTVCANRMTICYTISAGFIFGGLLGYVNTAQQIFQDYYDTGEMFPIFFGIGAASLGISFFVNARIVKQFGMRYVVLRSMVAMGVISVAFLGYELMVHGAVPLAAFTGYIMLSSFCMGMCFGNLNALAMVPMGHIAGMASAVIGAVSLVFSISISALVGQFYSGDLYPVTLGFLASAVLSLGLMFFAEAKPEDEENIPLEKCQ